MIPKKKGEKGSLEREHPSLYMITKLESIISNTFLIPFRKSKDIQIDLRSTVKNSIFEGNNSVQRGCKLINCNVGRFTYISKETILSNCVMGRFCSIAPQVRNIGGMHPIKDFVSTHPAFYSQSVQKSFVQEDKFEEYKWLDTQKGIQNIIGNDVWIGTGATIMEGTIIGDGAVIAANAHVVKNVPPYAVVGGNPAQVIRYRFTEEQIESLLKIKWWDMEKKFLEKNVEKFENIDKFIEYIETI